MKAKGAEDIGTADITRREKLTDAKVVGTGSRRAVIITTSAVSMRTPRLLDGNPRRWNIVSANMDQATTVMEMRLIIMLT